MEQEGGLGEVVDNIFNVVRGGWLKCAPRLMLVRGGRGVAVREQILVFPKAWFKWGPLVCSSRVRQGWLAGDVFSY